LINASLAHYPMPSALEVPRLEVAHTVTASPLNPLGIKGAGEAELNEIPLSPNRLFRADHQIATIWRT
jgi:aerobic carbon-monoxide dehydrogenase large subunit